MNIRRRTVIIASVCLLVFAFVVREFFVSRSSGLRFFGEQGVAFLQVPSGYILSFGDKESSRGQTVLRAIQPYFSKQEILALDAQEAGSEFSGKDFTAQIFSPHIIKVASGGKSFWFLGEVTEEEIEDLKMKPVSFESDFWVISKDNGFVGMLDAFPHEGILYLGERKPLKLLIEFAKKKSLPLISIKETEGFRLTWSGKQGKVWVRK